MSKKSPSSPTPGPSGLVQKLSTTVGNALGKRKRGRPAKIKVSLPTVPESPTLSTSAMATVGITTLSESLSPSTSVESTSENSSFPTVSMMSPTGYVENGLMPNTEDLLRRMTPINSLKLKELAEGRGEPLSTTVDEIIRYMCEDESDWSNAPLNEALDYYIEVSFI